MLAPCLHPAEPDRLASLYATGQLDSAAEARFDRITRELAERLGVRIALVSLVDADRQWFKARHGLDATETPRDLSFCGHAILDDQALVVIDARDDARFADNPLVTGDPSIRFYAGQPLRGPGGQPVGTLCAIHDEPRELSLKDRYLLRSLARQVERELSPPRAAPEGVSEAPSCGVWSGAPAERLVERTLCTGDDPLVLLLRLTAEADLPEGATQQIRLQLEERLKRELPPGITLGRLPDQAWFALVHRQSRARRSELLQRLRPMTRGTYTVFRARGGGEPPQAEPVSTCLRWIEARTWPQFQALQGKG